MGLILGGADFVDEGNNDLGDLGSLPYLNIAGSESGNTNIQLDNSNTDSSEIDVKNLKISENSYGEIVFSWLVSDLLNQIDHFLILCKFQGITAPLGVVAKLNGINNYEFLDQETSPYIGFREYFVNIILRSGTIIRINKSVTYRKIDNLPKKFTIPLNKDEINKSYGLRNKTKTIGDTFIEKPIVHQISARITAVKPNSTTSKSLSVQKSLLLKLK